jgi:putative ABC transport system substrate-binding protein
MDRLSRRRFLRGGLGLVGLGLLAGCGGLSSPVAQPSRVPRIGWLSPVNGPGSREFEAFRQGLRELGYIEGQTLALEHRLAGGDNERMPALAAELVGLGVDAILADGQTAAVAARDATSTIPIVMGAINDPVGSGLVASLGQPGGNITGLVTTVPGFAGKRLELLKEAVPRLSRVAAVNDPASPTVNLTDARAAARSLGLELAIVEIQTTDDLEGAFRAAVGARADGMMALGGPLQASARGRIAELAVQHRLPGIFPDRDYALAGGLLAYGPQIPDNFRRAATYVDKILKGARPGDLPIEQPTKYDLVINLKSAQALGITIPPSILAQATEVIQ